MFADVSNSNLLLFMEAIGIPLLSELGMRLGFPNKVFPVVFKHRWFRGLTKVVKTCFFLLFKFWKCETWTRRLNNLMYICSCIIHTKVACFLAQKPPVFSMIGCGAFNKKRNTSMPHFTKGHGVLLFLFLHVMRPVIVLQLYYTPKLAGM